MPWAVDLLGILTAGHLRPRLPDPLQVGRGSPPQIGAGASSGLGHRGPVVTMLINHHSEDTTGT